MSGKTLNSRKEMMGDIVAFDARMLVKCFQAHITMRAVPTYQIANLRELKTVDLLYRRFRRANRKGSERWDMRNNVLFEFRLQIGRRREILVFLHDMDSEVVRIDNFLASRTY
jgi:hypothetical protein